MVWFGLVWFGLVWFGLVLVLVLVWLVFVCGWLFGGGWVNLLSKISKLQLFLFGVPLCLNPERVIIRFHDSAHFGEENERKNNKSSFIICHG